MARHRDVRGLENNHDYHDDGGDFASSYGSSYCDEVSLSASVERDYMYKRNASGTTPKISHFFGRSPSVESVPEEDLPNSSLRDSDEEVFGARGRRHSSGSSLLEGLSSEEQEQLATCLEYILNVVGESMPEQQIKETIVRCEYDEELALNTLLNNPMGSSSSGGQTDHSRTAARHLEPHPTPWSPPAAPNPPLEPAVVPKQKAYGYAEVFLPTESSPAVNGAAPKATPAPSTTKKANRLNIRSRSPSPSASTPSVPT